MRMLAYVTGCTVTDSTPAEIQDCLSDPYLASLYPEHRLPDFRTVTDRDGDKLLVHYKLFSEHKGNKLYELHIASPKQYRAKANLLAVGAAYSMYTKLTTDATAIVGATPKGGSVSLFCANSGTYIFKSDDHKDYHILTKQRLACLLTQEI